MISPTTYLFEEAPGSERQVLHIQVRVAGKIQCGQTNHALELGSACLETVMRQIHSAQRLQLGHAVRHNFDVIVAQIKFFQ
jgi:hypothetical protein